MKKFLLTSTILALSAVSCSAQVIGTGNKFDQTRDEVGIVRDGTFEGYVTWDSFRAAINDQLPDDEFVVSGDVVGDNIVLTMASGAVVIIDASYFNDAAAIAVHIAADGDTIVDSFTSADGSIANAGTADGLDLDVNVPAIISSDAGNAITTGGDGNLFVAPAAPSTVKTSAPLSGDGSVGSPVALAGGGSVGDVLTNVGGSAVWQTPAAGGLTSVATDTTINGDGTAGSPLGVANPLPTGGTESDVLTWVGGVPTWQAPASGGGGLVTVATTPSLTGDGTVGNPLDVAGAAGAAVGEVATSDGAGGITWSAPAAGGGGGITGYTGTGDWAVKGTTTGTISFQMWTAPAGPTANGYWQITSGVWTTQGTNPIFVTSNAEIEWLASNEDVAGVAMVGGTIGIDNSSGPASASWLAVWQPID